MSLMPKESSKLIAKSSKNVFIEEEGVKILACEVLEGLKNGTISINNFSQSELHPNSGNKKAVDWIFVLDTLNFSFWPRDGDNKWNVNGHTGYFALCAAIKRAVDEGIPIIDPNYYVNITCEELGKILRPDEGAGIAPLLEERVKSLQQVGRILLDKFNGTFVECIKASNKSAEKLLKIIVNNFECYRDEADFYGHRVSFYKRAQILIGDIWSCYKAIDLGEFNDIDVITMFADYRVPQVLLHFGAMRYSNPLLSTLQSGTELVEGCLEEIEIRGCSIEVVERVVDRVRILIKQYPNLNIIPNSCNAIIVDQFLWEYRRKNCDKLESLPFHKVRTIYY
ncbi:queuosine salvage protein-like isoform X3 [Aphidius gifuensis]|uniref:queuosine salvage protein-like isoform X3 n=1 Tax=Aphidius gifuensis TaxID=684658 RepID=UPI001CDBBE46|nr:queuosine salvage protein-like isoform X3 [Aphidius gifuensis]